MGACSSKPKTTEYEDSMEPTEKTKHEISNANNKVTVDVAQKGPSEPSLQRLLGESASDKETHDELQKKEAIVGAAEVLKERESMVVAEEEPLKEGILSSDEILSASGEEEGKVGYGVAAEGEACKEEAAIPDEEKAEESLEKASVTEKDVDLSAAQDNFKPLALDGGQSAELYSTDSAPESGSRAAESAEFAPPSTEEKVIDAPSELQPAGSSDIQAPTSDVKGADISEEEEIEPSRLPPALVSDLPEENTIETMEEEIEPSRLPPALVSDLPDENAIEAEQTMVDEGLQGGSTMDPPPAAIAEDGVSEESEAVGTLENSTVDPPAEAANENIPEPLVETAIDASIVGKTSETQSEITAEESIAECTTEPQAETAEESFAVEPHAESTGEEIYVESIVESQPEAPTPDEGIVETTAEPQGETTEDDLIASIVLPQAQTTPEESLVEAKTPDEAIAEPYMETTMEESTAEPQVGTPSPEVKPENADTDVLELSTEQANNASSEGELTFEDASDVPLKAESSTYEPQVSEELSISKNA